MSDQSPSNAVSVVLALAVLGLFGVVAWRTGSGGGETDGHAVNDQPTSTQFAPNSKPSPKPNQGPIVKSKEDGEWPSVSAAEDAPNVIFVILDTVRSDHLSVCGYERDTTPTLNRLKDQGAGVNCTAQAPRSWTLPSHASYFTGLDPVEHGAHAIITGVKSLDGVGSRARKLERGKAPHIAEVLKGEGYTTLALSSNPVVGRGMGLFQGVQFARTAETWGRLFGEDYFPAVKRIMEKNGDRKYPFFLTLNIADAHRPWDAIGEDVGWIPPTNRQPFDKLNEESTWRRFLEGKMTEEEGAEFTGNVANVYDMGVWQADRNLGQVVDYLRDEWCQPRGCRFVITSDHGEMLGEHGLVDHGHYSWASNVQVPVVTWDTRNDKIAALPEGPINAIHTFDLVRDGAFPANPDPVQTMAWPHIRRCNVLNSAAFCSTSAAIWAGDEKVMWQDEDWWVFDIKNDPMEAQPRPLPEDHPLRAALEALVERVKGDAGDEEDVDPDVMELLKAVGYAE